MGPPGQLFAPAAFADAGTVLVAGSVATAPSDGTRLVTGTSKGCGPVCGIAEGPFVLTDARVFDNQNLNFASSAGNVTWFYTVPSGVDCTVSCSSFSVSSTTVDVEALIPLTTSKTTNGAGFPSDMAGGRYFIPVGRRLCVCKAVGSIPNVVQGSWSGFVPYQ